MSYKIICILICCLLPFFGVTQIHTPLFPNLEDDDLLDAIQQNYIPSTVLTYDMARDTMFSKIYNINNNLTCVYSGHTIFINPNEDPTQAAFMNGANNGINTEHTYPRSKGAENGNAQSDMHHLFPTRTPVNSARGSFPFDEINDNTTDEWFRNNQSQSNIPAANIRDDFSEVGNGKFEPREDFKGNVARAVFYFYTMYRNQALNADPSFFNIQRATLLQWHREDPVDQTEYDRTLQIATYQSDKPNPFILDTLLVYRIYCTNNQGVCDLSVPTTEVELSGFSLGQAYPNPAYSQSIHIPYTLGTNATVRLTLYDALGQKIQILTDRQQTAGDYEAEAKVPNTGVWFYQLEVQTDRGNQSFTGRGISSK